jgi:hypothetical protein
MAMLDKGRMVMVDSRSGFEKLRDFPAQRVHELEENDQLVRQFLRGDADGPITRRKAQTNYAEDLLGESAPVFGEGPAVESTRTV